MPSSSGVAPDSQRSPVRTHASTARPWFRGWSRSTSPRSPRRGWTGSRGRRDKTSWRHSRRGCSAPAAFSCSWRTSRSRTSTSTAHRHVFVEYADGTTARVRPVASSNEELIETIQTLAAHEGLNSRAFDTANVRVNLRLPDGSRLYAVQSVTREPVVSIRKHRHPVVSLKDLVGLGTLDEDLADFLAACVRARKNLMIAGATGAGKTTLLRALAAEIPSEERLLTVERSLELGLDEDVEQHPNAVAFEERLANAEGAGAVTMAQLVRDTLRLNPSRVIVGEVLGDEVVTMLNAMTQGNDGSLSTIHANSSADVVHKIATYAIQAPERLPWEATVRLVASGLDFIVFVRRVRGDGNQQRVVESVREVAGVTDDRNLATNELWGADSDGQVRRSYGVQVRCEADLIEAGWRPEQEAWT